MSPQRASRSSTSVRTRSRSAASSPAQSTGVAAVTFSSSQRPRSCCALAMPFCSPFRSWSAQRAASGPTTGGPSGGVAPRAARSIAFVASSWRQARQSAKSTKSASTISPQPPPHDLLLSHEARREVGALAALVLRTADRVVELPARAEELAVARAGVAGEARHLVALAAAPLLQVALREAPRARGPRRAGRRRGARGARAAARGRSPSRRRRSSARPGRRSRSGSYVSASTAPVGAKDELDLGGLADLERERGRDGRPDERELTGRARPGARS